MSITCSYTEDDDIIVQGASSLEEAREAATAFFRADCQAQCLILTNGYKLKWKYEDEPQPEDWIDGYFFSVVDAEPLPLNGGNTN